MHEHVNANYLDDISRKKLRFRMKHMTSAIRKASGKDEVETCRFELVGYVTFYPPYCTYLIATWSQQPHCSSILADLAAYVMNIPKILLLSTDKQNFIRNFETCVWSKWNHKNSNRRTMKITINKIEPANKPFLLDRQNHLKSRYACLQLHRWDRFTVPEKFGKASCLVKRLTGRLLECWCSRETKFWTNGVSAATFLCLDVCTTHYSTF